MQCVADELGGIVGEKELKVITMICMYASTAQECMHSLSRRRDLGSAPVTRALTRWDMVPSAPIKSNNPLYSHVEAQLIRTRMAGDLRNALSFQLITYK